MFISGTEAKLNQSSKSENIMNPLSKSRQHTITNKNRIKEKTQKELEIDSQTNL